MKSGAVAIISAPNAICRVPDMFDSIRGTSRCFGHIRTGSGTSPGIRRSLSGTLPKTRRSTPTKNRLRITLGLAGPREQPSVKPGVQPRDARGAVVRRRHDQRVVVPGAEGGLGLRSACNLCGLALGRPTSDAGASGIGSERATQKKKE